MFLPTLQNGNQGFDDVTQSPISKIVANLEQLALEVEVLPACARAHMHALRRTITTGLRLGSSNGHSSNSAVKKVKAGKKVERTLREKIATPVEDEGPKTAEDYVCTGILELDFNELCARMEILAVPIVMLRPQAFTPSLPSDGMESVVASEKSFNSSIAPTKEPISFFRPSIQTEQENDESKLVKAIYIRGWMIDQRFIFIFQKCLPALSNLQIINLWNVGLTETTFTALIAIMRQCYSLRTVVLDGNPIPHQPYHLLLGEDITIHHLTLRNNQIDDAGAKLIGAALSTIKKCNKTLLSLTLSFNHITDEGAIYIADGLRLNRTLLWLSLAYNQIGDRGAIKLAEVLGSFALTHEEVVERRLLHLEMHEIPRSPLFSKRPDSKSDRSSNSQFGSSTNMDKGDKSQKSTKTLSKKKDKKDVFSQDKLTLSSSQLLPKKDELKMLKRGSIGVDSKISRTKILRPGKDKRYLLHGQEVHEHLNPLLEFVEHRNGNVYLAGNICLMSMNLTHNRITETGVKAFLTMIKEQIQNAKLCPDGRSSSGLLRLSLTKNAFPATCETDTRLQELMLARDPIAKHRVICTPAPMHGE
uniref:leucine-rich repeat-containing protein 71 n=1 Tax=Pristiophorus japonicus TaxID=55135 RepID=UPI00398E689D